MEIFVESKKTLLVTDAQGSIKLITEISGAVAFLDSFIKLYRAFSVHLKHHQYKIMPDAQKNVNLVSNYLLDTISTVKSKLDTTRELNGACRLCRLVKDSFKICYHDYEWTYKNI